MMNKQSLRGSQTMPQLHYTREDIQEQYQRVRLPETTTTTTTTPSSSSVAKKRARSSGSRRHAHSPASSDEEGAGESGCEENSAGEERGRFPSRSARKRRRRARSAALFSACFHMLAPATTAAATPTSGRSQRRSILAHLGLGGQSRVSTGQPQPQSQPQQRPLSSSQTAGNLQQVCNTATPTQRKHVSFGGQRRPSADCPPQSSNTAQQQTAAGSTGGGAQTANQSPQQPQFGQPAVCVPPSESGRGNNVIMRNYRAHQPLAAQEAKGK